MSPENLLAISSDVSSYAGFREKLLPLQASNMLSEPLTSIVEWDLLDPDLEMSLTQAGM